jgi:Cu+-exporting ATPase
VASCCGGKHGAADEGGALATDPVCGMKVDRATVKHRFSYKGEDYVFCGARCRERFAAEPEKFLKPRESEPALPPGTIYTCPMHPEVRQVGPGSCPICGMALEPEEVTLDDKPDPELVDMTRRFWIALVLTLPVFAIEMGGHAFGLELVPMGWANWISFALATPVVLWAGAPFFVRGWQSLVTRNLNMFTLIAMGVGVAYVYSVVGTLAPHLFPPAFRDMHGQVAVYFEAAAVITVLVLLGQVLELRARAQTSGAIRALLGLAPKTARRITDHGDEDVAIEAIAVGDRLRVRPGEKVPVDGIVIEGRAVLDESMVTGESMPVSKAPGEKLVAATINKQGTLRARATAVGSDTALAQIVKLVQEAQNSKAPAQRLADRAAFWLVLVALVGGLGTFFLWWGVVDREVLDALLFAITVVVITCPDALGLATPTAIMVGTGLGARRGILFKNAIAIEQSARLDTVVLDKTGTLTRGEPEVVALVTDGLAEDYLLRLVAAVERESEHPLAEAIVRAAEARGLDPPRAEGFEAVAGHGALASVEGRRLAVGNARLLEREDISLDGLAQRAAELAGEGRTVVHVALDGRATALIAIADAPRETAVEAVAALRELGIRPVMLTGDNRATAERIGAEVGIEEVIGEVLPGDKASRVVELQRQGRTVAMVGDGVNDAPALAQADVGIAIGAGTDVAIETADIVLMRSDPLDVATAVTIGRGTVRKMRQNLGWAIGYNSLALPIAAGVFEPWGFTLRPELAAISMSGSSVLVAVNALLLKRLRL